jgi:hypothetical protein
VDRAIASLAKAVRCSIDWALEQADSGDDVTYLFDAAVPAALELHDYQEDFLANKLKRNGLRDKASPLRCVLNYAAAHPELWTEIFRTVHCRRCDNLPDNLSTADNAWKKSKKPVSFGLTPQQELFLDARVANEEGAEIAEKGPVNRALADVSPHMSIPARDWPKPTSNPPVTCDFRADSET